jgi:hypothetical protein
MTSTADWHDALSPQEPVRIRAGAGGATLMVWGADAASMLMSDVGSYLMGAPDAL